MFLIGDVHGLFREYLDLISVLDQTLVLGDIGMGFGNDTVEDMIEVIPPSTNHRLLRGNHDNSIIFQKHPNALPVWGYDESMDMFWLGGGFSVDRNARTPGWNWWSGQQKKYYTRYLEQKSIQNMLIPNPELLFPMSVPRLLD